MFKRQAEDVALVFAHEKTTNLQSSVGNFLLKAATHEHHDAGGGRCMGMAADFCLVCSVVKKQSPAKKRFALMNQ